MEVKESGLPYFAMVLVAIGAINWGFAILNMNLVTMITDIVGGTVLANVIYGVIALSGIYLGIKLAKKYVR